MDQRIRKWIESAAGFTLEEFPNQGISIRLSSARDDQPKNRLLVQQVVGKNGALVTGIERVVNALSDFTRSLTSLELFSPVGNAEIRRLLSPVDAVSLDDTYGMDFFLTERERLHPVDSKHKVFSLKKGNIPPLQYDLRMRERRSLEKEDFTWAFACYHEDPTVRPERLVVFGPRCASIAIIIWVNDDIAGFGVATERSLEGQGYALTAVSAATQWILNQGAIAWYGAYSNNIPSLRIARRLGFSLVQLSLRA